jgi:amino acid transporter
MKINQILENIDLDPKMLFLIDGFGAILSAFLIGVLLVKFENYIGIPTSTLYFLATLLILFAAYDLYCFRKQNEKLGRYLKGIAIINLLYCFLSIGFAFYHSRTITNLGWAYIIVEILIVVTLAILELEIAKRKI